MRYDGWKVRGITGDGIWLWLIVGVLMLNMSCSDRQPEAVSRFREGDPFPALVLTRLDGGQVSFEKFNDKVVLLNIWATWCAPCRKELPSLERLSKVLDAKRFTVIGLSIDNDDHVVREYLIDKGIGLTSYIDEDASIATDVLGVTKYPDTFVIAPGGRFVYHVVGDREWDTPAMEAALEEVYRGSSASLKKVSAARHE
jgi:thiol-disulfide isomerase/thioredoxin